MIEKIFEEEHLLAGLIAILAIKFYWDLTKSKDKEMKEMIKELKADLSHHRNTLSSYMADQIKHESRLTRIEEKLEDLLNIRRG